MSLLRNISQTIIRSSNQPNIKTLCLASNVERCMQTRQAHSVIKTTQISRNCQNTYSGLKSLAKSNSFQINTSLKYSSEADGEKSDISARISGLVAKSDVVVFMKGVPSAPRCGFSNAVCQIFRMHNVEVDSHDVLEDEELRQGIKEFSNWPTIPQVYFKGEFIGGCDILLQMHQSGELIEELQKIGIKSALLTDEEGDK